MVTLPQSQYLYMANIKLKEIPDEVLDFILTKQAEIKCKKKKALYSQESTVYQIIKEHPDFKEKKKVK